MTGDTDLPKGFTCECGKEHRFSPWAYAHWREVLRMTCDGCGRAYEILRGRPKLAKQKKAKEGAA